MAETALVFYSITALDASVGRRSTIAAKREQLSPTLLRALHVNCFSIVVEWPQRIATVLSCPCRGHHTLPHSPFLHDHRRIVRLFAEQHYDYFPVATC